MKPKTIRTTLSLPSDLLQNIDIIISQGQAKSRNEFVAKAIADQIAILRRAEINAQLAEMTQNPEHQAEILKMEAEFASSSWEALQLGENQV
jgi:metal-responsive CopG/Arc/MetJ family transcriptional regulator